jgi:outer membrane receptor protein involved in Fe transport
VRMITRFSTLVYGLFIAGNSVAADDYLEFSLEQLMQVKISASTLTDKSLRTVPSSVSVFTRAQIQAMGIDTLGELLNFVPGFQDFRQADSGYEYYHSARGRRSDAQAREVLVLIDGQRFQNEGFSGAFMPITLLSNIEKVEVIRGPGSALYGSNAFTGVINITTRKNTNEVSIHYGNHNNTFGQILYNTTINDYAVDVAAHVFADNGENFRLENTATHKFYDSRDPNAGYGINIKIAGDTTLWSADQQMQSAREFYVVESSSNQYNEMIKKYSNIQFKKIVNWNDSDSTHYIIRYSELVRDIQAGFFTTKANFHGKLQSFDFNIINDFLINANHSVQFGLEQRYLQMDKGVLNTGIGDFLLTNAYDSNVTGLYAQSQYKVSEKTELTLGARYDNYSNISSAFSPRFGLTQQISDIQTLKLLVGKAFRAPTFADLSVSNNTAIQGNPNLKPETITTWELVWMGNWKHHSLTLTAFDSCVDDAIVQGFVGSARQFVNAQSPENSQGVEVEYLAQLASNWQLRTQYSLFNTLPDSAFRQADNLASLILNYQHEKWNINLSANHAGEREMLAGSDKVTLHSYWLMNSKVQYALGGDENMYVQFKNMLNAKYVTPAQGAAFTQGIPNRGREVSVGFDWKF